NRLGVCEGIVASSGSQISADDPRVDDDVGSAAQRNRCDRAAVGEQVIAIVRENGGGNGAAVGQRVVARAQIDVACDRLCVRERILAGAENYIPVNCAGVGEGVDAVTHVYIAADRARIGDCVITCAAGQ